MFHDRHPHRRPNRVLGGAALAVALSMASPAGAYAAGTGPAGIWSWIEGLLADRIGAVTPGRAPHHRPAVPAKELVCPPAGCPTTPGTTQGPATDPDGKPH
ncbi:MAG TPA: hypothetical protein VGQ28_10645 [Thermoanaerobaculia bacterium]|jgi:hypothetical protein|nr:hypothetical protein [Thermoanaerobaculia bacterium]